MLWPVCTSNDSLEIDVSNQVAIVKYAMTVTAAVDCTSDFLLSAAVYCLGQQGQTVLSSVTQDVSVQRDAPSPINELASIKE